MIKIQPASTGLGSLRIEDNELQVAHNSTWNSINFWYQHGLPDPTSSVLWAIGTNCVRAKGGHQVLHVAANEEGSYHVSLALDGQPVRTSMRLWGALPGWCSMVTSPSWGH